MGIRGQADLLSGLGDLRPWLGEAQRKVVTMVLWCGLGWCGWCTAG